MDASSGGFSNQVSNVIVLLALKLYYNLQIFLPESNYEMLREVFPYLQAMPAEKFVCDFRRDFATFQDNQAGILDSPRRYHLS